MISTTGTQNGRRKRTIRQRGQVDLNSSDDLINVSANQSATIRDDEKSVVTDGLHEDVKPDIDLIGSPGSSEKENASVSRSPVSPVSKDVRPTLVPLDSNALTLNPPSTPLKPLELLPIRSPTRSPTRSPFKSPSRALFAKEASPINHEPRLVITRLELTNFKSYAGKQVIGPFNPSFSAVVGPNGSGKSNVIDSMLFVFGFRASKMRQAKLSELIHNSELFPNLDSCAVDIYFQNVLDLDDDKSEFIPGTELVVSRKAFRNNSSKYYINGKESNYTIVTEMLKEKGIDLDHKRFLILQGEVESIAQMKPKAEKDSDDGLLEYLEDIIGTSDYKDQIQKSMEQIDVLNDICVEKKNRYELVLKEKDSLEEQKDEAIRFLQKEKLLMQKKDIAFQIDVISDKTKLEKATAELEALKDELEKGKVLAKEHANEIKSLQKEMSSTKKQHEQVSQKIKDLESKQKLLDRAKVAYEEKVKHLLNKKKKSEKVLSTTQQLLRESEARLKEHTDEQSNYQQKIDDLNKEYDSEREVLSKMKTLLAEKTFEFSKQIEVLKEKLQPWIVKLDAKRGEVELAKSQLQMLQNRKKDAAKEVEDSKLSVKKIIESGQTKEQEKNTRQEELEHISEQIVLGEEEISQVQKKLSDMKEKVQHHRNKTMDARNSLSNVQNKSKVLTGLMKLQKTGRIDGFYGRLGDLGTIDDKFDIAISTACPLLDNMVVDTVEVGQLCIEYLRKNQLGFGNFTVLTKLSNFNLNKIQTPGNVPRLFDLIKPKDLKFLPAFYSVMRDTLVAKDMNEARKVAYGQRRWRVVTLDGKLIDTSGTLSGGGNYVSRGAMSSKPTSDLTQDDVDRLNHELAEKEKKLKILEDTYYEMVLALDTMKKRKPELELKISTLQMDIDSLANEMAQAKAHYKELLKAQEEKDDGKIDAEMSRSEKEISRLESELSEIKRQSKDIENEIEALNDRIMEVGGVELKMQNSKVDSIKSQIDLTSAKRKQDIIAIKKLESEINRHNKVIAQNDKEIAQTSSELESIKESYENENNAQNFEDQINELKLELESSTEVLEKFQEQLKEKQQSIDDFESSEIELSNKIEKLESLIRHCKRNIEETGLEVNNIEGRDLEPLLGWLEDGSELKVSLLEDSRLMNLTEEELRKFDVAELKSEIEDLETYLDGTKVDVDMLIDYTKRHKEFSERKTDLNRAVEERETIEQTYEDLKRKRLDEFMEGFNEISMTLKEMYQMITMGGNAELELVDSLDPFSEGILFSVMPPKKSWRNISNLSGGEKTLSSLALVFALHRYKPTPLYVMDEIDAALDFRNVSIVANYIKESTRNAQFVVISLRNNMFELAQQLVGIYKVNNMTRSISLQNKDLLSDDPEK